MQARPPAPSGVWSYYLKPSARPLSQSCVICILAQTATSSQAGEFPSSAVHGHHNDAVDARFLAAHADGAQAELCQSLLSQPLFECPRQSSRRSIQVFVPSRILAAAPVTRQTRWYFPTRHHALCASSRCCRAATRIAPIPRCCLINATTPSPPRSRAKPGE